jgi:hypothetical protein
MTALNLAQASDLNLAQASELLLNITHTTKLTKLRQAVTLMESLLRRVVLYLRIPVGIIALAGLLLSGAVHAASWRGIDIESAWPSVWVLHYALFPIFILTIFTAGAVSEQKRLDLRTFLGLVPSWIRIILVATLLYAVVTFLIFTPLSGAGDPVIADGRYFFNDHGVMRGVSEDQFHFLRSVSLRLYSSVWIYLYLFSAIYLLGARRSPK